MIGDKYILVTIYYGTVRGYITVTVTRENKASWKLSNDSLLYKEGYLRLKSDDRDVYEFSEEKLAEVKALYRKEKMKAIRNRIKSAGISNEELKEYIESLEEEK